MAGRPPVFGDFWDRAARAVAVPADPDPPADIRPIQAAAGRAVMVIRRYLDDAFPAVTGSGRGLWPTAIAHGMTSASRASAALGRLDPPTAAAPGTLAWRLDRYTEAMTYGRDLLHTHLGTLPDGTRAARSDWATVLSSAPVARALLAGVAEHAQAIALQLAAADHAGVGEADRRQVLAAADQLREIHGAVQAAQWQAPVLARHRRLLAAIPANVTLKAEAPQPGAPVPELCAGTINAARRAVQTRHMLAGTAAWSPELTAESMRHTAANNVVTSLSTEVVYRGLAVRAQQFGYHGLVPGLDTAADRAAESRRAWLSVARAWDGVVTDSRGYLSEPAREAAHLALWTGRLAYADPAWTPARGPSPTARNPADLAPGREGLPDVAGALHFAADSLAAAALGDLETVSAAARAGRLYVATRSLPDLQYDVPRPYAEAPAGRVGALVAMYADAADTCKAALQSAAEVAASVDAPSRVLSDAREATASEPEAPRGRLEQTLIELGVRDAETLRRGMELDEQAQRLLANVYRANFARPQPVVELDPGHQAAAQVEPAPEAGSAAAGRAEIGSRLDTAPPNLSARSGRDMPPTAEPDTVPQIEPGI